MAWKNKYNTEFFIERSKKVHIKRTYSYDKVNYLNSYTKVIITCQRHGDFLQKPHSHLSGQGCIHCMRSPTQREYIAKCILKHGNKYNYTKTKLINLKHKVTITCPDHGDFLQRAESHYKYGCKKCRSNIYSKSGFIRIAKGRKATVYVIQLTGHGEKFVKIGLTCTSVKVRFYGHMPYKYKTIRTFELGPGDAFSYERELHKLFSNYRYTPKIFFGGATECFNKSILAKIKEIC